jgi:processive 1,2-diacylglycerol beta-glucosyltransferase
MMTFLDRTFSESANSPGESAGPSLEAARLLPAAPPSARRAPRILILSAAVGTGHLRAAEAVEVAARRLYPEAYVRNVDVLTLASTPFRRCYGRMYLDFVNAAPAVLGFFYNLMDRPHTVNEQSNWDRLRIRLELWNLTRFLDLLQAEPWDVIINTHFLPGEIISTLRKRHQFATPQAMVTTDYETHHLWVTEPCDLYFTATDEGRLYLEKQKLPPGKTRVVGIPIHPIFGEPKDRAACLAHQGLRGDRPIVLQLAGGFGVGRIEEIHRALLEIEVPLDLVVVAGRNAAAKQKIEAIAGAGPHRVHVLGFTEHMDELLAVADLIVSKPGGLTTAEAMAMGVPLAIVDPIPGQEERNSDYLLENGAAIKINHLATLAVKVNPLLREPGRLEQMRANAKRIGRPRAAFDVVEQSLALIGARQNSDPRVPTRATAHTAPAGGAAQRVWHSARTWFDLCAVGALHFFARVWHHCLSHGGQRLPPTGPAIVVANHPNYSDPAFLVAACLRRLTFLHAKESFYTPVLHALFARFGSIPVARTGHDVGAVHTALARLRAGEAMGVFPEGEVTTSGRPIGAPRGGAAFLALRSQAPVYPVHISGGPQSGSILRDWLWPGPSVQVVVGPALDLSAYYNRPINRAVLAEVTALLMRRVSELAPLPPEQEDARQPSALMLQGVSR